LGERLEEALATLSPDHRAVVTLDQAGFAYAEIAQTLGIEVGTVKSRMSRARVHLRQRLRPVPAKQVEPAPSDERSG
jgi:RNA polymerase sigma-70 factor (ECF subfamily)